MTLPLAVIEGMGWKKGDAIQVRIAGKDRLELVKEPYERAEKKLKDAVL